MSEKLTYEELEEALQKSKQQQSLIFDSVGDILYDIVVDSDDCFRFRSVNNAFLNATGLIKEQIIGKRIEQVIPESSISMITANYKKAIKENRIVRWTETSLYPAGEKFGEVTIVPVLNKNGICTHLVGSVHDLTKWKQAENALKDNKLQLESILNNLDSSIYIADMKSYEILFMNDHMKNLFGEDLTGGLCWKTIHGNQDGPCNFCTNDKLIAADGNAAEPYIWEFYNQKLKKWYSLHDMAIKWLDSDFSRMEIAIDISDTKHCQLEQKKKNETLKNNVKDRTADLEAMNTALKVLLNKRDDDKKEMEEKIFANHRQLISPLINNLKNSLTQKAQKDMIDILESELKNIISPFSRKLSDPMVNLTPTEIKVAGLIKFGKSNKEIAEAQNSAIRTITYHRENIRKKLGLKNKKINLRSYLLTLK